MIEMLYVLGSRWVRGTTWDWTHRTAIPARVGVDRGSPVGSLKGIGRTISDVKSGRVRMKDVTESAVRGLWLTPVMGCQSMELVNDVLDGNVRQGWRWKRARVKVHSPAERSRGSGCVNTRDRSG